MIKLMLFILLTVLLVGCADTDTRDRRLLGQWDVASTPDKVEFSEGGVGRFLTPEGNRMLHSRFDWNTEGSDLFAHNAF